MSADPRAVMLDRLQVAARLGWSPSTVKRAQNAVDPRAWPPPMTGWKRVGPTTKPVYKISEADLIAYIDNLPAA